MIAPEGLLHVLPCRGTGAHDPYHRPAQHMPGSTMNVGQNSSNGTVCALTIQYQTQLEYGIDTLKETALYGSAVCTALTYILYVFVTVRILDKYVSWTKRSDALMVLSVYPVISTVSLLAIFLPRSAVLCDAISSVYFSIVLWRFSDSIPRSFGGRDDMVRELSSTDVTLRTLPCCCCCWWLRPRKFSRSFLNWSQAAVMQFLVIRPIIMALAAILWSDGLYDTGNISPRESYLYIHVINSLSTIFAIYGLTLVFKASKAHLASTLIAGKFLVMQLVILVTSFQHLIFTGLSAAGVIRCTAFMPANAISNEYYHVALIIELLVIGAAATAVYAKAFERERQFFILSSTNNVARELNSSSMRSRTLTVDSGDDHDPSSASSGVVLAINSLY